MLINNLVASIGFKYGDRIIVIENVAFKLEPVHEVGRSATGSEP